MRQAYDYWQDQPGSPQGTGPTRRRAGPASGHAHSDAHAKRSGERDSRPTHHTPDGAHALVDSPTGASAPPRTDEPNRSEAHDSQWDAAERHPDTEDGEGERTAHDLRAQKATATLVEPRGLPLACAARTGAIKPPLTKREHQRSSPTARSHPLRPVTRPSEAPSVAHSTRITRPGREGESAAERRRSSRTLPRTHSPPTERGAGATGRPHCREKRTKRVPTGKLPSPLAPQK